MGAGPGDAHRDQDNQSGAPPIRRVRSARRASQMGRARANAFLTRLASPPDAGPASLAEDGPASIRRRQARAQEEAPGNSLALPVAPAKAPAEAVAARKASAPLETQKSAPPASAPPPVSREKRSWPGLLATSLLAGAVSLSAYAALSPAEKNRISARAQPSSRRAASGWKPLPRHAARG